MNIAFHPFPSLYSYFVTLSSQLLLQISDLSHGTIFCGVEESVSMVIEWLKIQVPAELREKYIQKDEEVWTAFLASCPGFLGKEVWINPQIPTEIVLVIQWANRQAWKAVPEDALKKTEQLFNQVMGAEYPIIEAGEYQVRKFPQA